MALGSSLGSLIVKIETDLTSLNTGLRNADRRVQQTRGAILKSTAQIGRAFTIMGAVTVGAVAAVTKAAIDFEDAFAGVRKTVDATEEEFRQLSDGLRKMSTEIPIAATELAKIQEIAGQLGIRGVAALEKFTKIVAFIGVTTDLTVEAAATDLARIAGIMQEPIENIDRMGSVVVELGNNSKATEAEIVAFTNRIAGAGKVAGLTTAELFAFGAAFTSVGVRAERGGTAVSKALIKMGTAVEEGGERLEEFADIAGLTSDEFREVYKKEGPGKAFALFIEGLGKAGLKGAAILKELELGNERIIQSFLSVGGATGILTEKLEMASEEWVTNTALLIEAEKRFETTASQLKLLTNNIVEVARRIGDTLLPALKPLIDKLKDVASKVAAWIKENPKLTALIVKFVAGIGALMLVLGPLLIVLPQIVASIEILAGSAALGALVLILGKVALVAGVAFATWKIGEKIGEVTGLNEVLSGPDGLFEKMFLLIDKAIIKWERLHTKIRDFFADINERALETPELQMLFGGEAGEEGEEEERFREKEEDKTAIVEGEVKKQRKIKGKETKDTATDRKLDTAAYSRDVMFRLSQLGNSLSQAGEMNKGAAKAAAAISLGLAIVHTASGVAKAFEDYSWPFSLVVAALVAAAGAIQIATISAQSFQEGTDSVPAMLTPGEIVIPRDFSDALRAGDIVIGGKEEIPRIIQMENNFTFEQVVLRHDIDIEDLGERIGESIEEAIGKV